MFNMLKRMIESNRYTTDYMKERVNVLYLANMINKDEYLLLIDMLPAVITV